MVDEACEAPEDAEDEDEPEAGGALPEGWRSGAEVGHGADVRRRGLSVRWVRHEGPLIARGRARGCLGWVVLTMLAKWGQDARGGGGME